MKVSGGNGYEKQGSAKTLKSIQITLAARLEKFNLESLAALTSTDELELGTLGEKKTALFALIPDNDTSFNFLVSILYTQLFQQLFYSADHIHGGSLPIPVSFLMIMTVYGRFFKLYMYTALAPIPLSTFAGEPSQNVGKSFIKGYCAVLLEGAVIVLACIIFSVFAASPPQVDTSAAAVTQVWAYVGELIFNMLVLVGSVKMSDRIIREMMGL